MDAKKKPDITPAFTGRDVSINEIAQGIGKSADFIKRGLRTGALDFGYAVKSDNSDRYGYYCPDNIERIIVTTVKLYKHNTQKIIFM